VGIFAPLTRKSPTEGPEASQELPDQVRAGLPHRFEAVGEALASGSGSLDACDVVGRRLAEDGASLDEALEALRATSLAVTGAEPSYADVRAVSVAWSEVTLAYLHQMSCEDPLTGLASLSHARTRLAELYRGHGRAGRTMQETHALVVVDIPEQAATGNSERFTSAMRMVRLGESARTVFPGTETIARLGARRIVVITARDENLGRRAALLRTMLQTADFPTRVWIEGVPATDAAVALLLDELARG
jgi:hypothetical protein